ncbi:MAG: DUF1641 domain-containing protein [Candidatus Promineifilaceae bacterium]
MENGQMNGLAMLEQRVNEPQTAAMLGRLLDRLERVESAVNRLADLVEQAPGMAAMAGDALDEAARRAAANGVDIEERLKVALTLAEKFTDPVLVAKLDQLMALADQAPGMVAMAGDAVDEMMGRAAAHGVDVEQRLKAALALAEKLTDPERMAKLEQLLALADQAPAMLAMMGDVADDVATRFDIQGRIQAGAGLVDKATQPATVEKLSEMFDVLLEAESGMLNPQAVRTLGRMAQAMVASQQTPPPQVGLFGLLKAINDPDLQRALGFLMQFGRQFGRQMA